MSEGDDESSVAIHGKILQQYFFLGVDKPPQTQIYKAYSVVLMRGIRTHILRIRIG